MLNQTPFQPFPLSAEDYPLLVAGYRVFKANGQEAYANWFLTLSQDERKRLADEFTDVYHKLVSLWNEVIMPLFSVE